MADQPTARDWRDTVFLPRTDFPMKAGLPQKEPAILARWQGDDLYGQIRRARAGALKFILHDGPPYANGDMHIGHALNHILKDMVVRTQTLLGKDAPYVPGWDCHGLPIEWKVEEQYRKGKRNKDEVPPAEFRAECRAYAGQWVDTQREQLKRLGIGGDWDHPYLTMATGAEAIIVSELLKFAETGQIYRGARPVMWSPVERTALAEAEVEYEDITSTQIDVAFEIVESPIPELVGAHAVIWTTTPWTIPVNQALAYGPAVAYSAIRFDADGRVLLLATELLHDSLKRIGRASEPAPIIWAGRGADLAGTLVRHPIHDFLRHPGESRDPASDASHAEGADMDPGVRRGDGAEEGSGNAHPAFFARLRPMLPGDFVTTDAGTGLVHMAPDHGEDDFALCKAHGIDPVFAVEGDGRYRGDWPWLGGQGSVINPKFNAPDGPICADLAAVGALLAATQDYRHSYPHSWRSKAKLIFRATPQWFIAMDRSLSRDLPAAGLGTAAGSHGEPSSRDGAEGLTLRETAMRAIGKTRWVPEKGRNRIAAMVEGRPDWVISRQRAWGVPITLFVDRRTGAYLNDPAVNARIVAAFREAGVEAWTEARAAEYLGPDRDPADYERVTDILDVWFDSGSTHAFVLASGEWPELRWPADLYLEGSDQHRGWFQSSLLESCGTRGRAPYDTVLTHGFTMDAKGLKMSKSLGNTVDPIALMKDTGADILRLWALSIDFTEDHRIGKEILAGVSDAYRKLRNSFRYLLGALDGWTEEERADIADMPDLERYMLHRLAVLDGELRQAVADYEFNRYVRLLTDFCNDELSAFFFDIRKDSLYCDAVDDPRRRACRTLLDVLFHALVRWLAPVLCFTAEEAWGTRYPDRGSVHLLEWPTIDEDWREPRLAAQWDALRAIRLVVNGEIEPKRRAKEIGSSLEARVVIGLPDARDRPNVTGAELAELLIVSEAVTEHSAHGPIAVVHRTDHHKCGRCWRHLPEVAADGGLCARCEDVVGE